MIGSGRESRCVEMSWAHSAVEGVQDIRSRAMFKYTHLRLREASGRRGSSVDTPYKIMFRVTDPLTIRHVDIIGPTRTSLGPSSSCSSRLTAS